MSVLCDQSIECAPFTGTGTNPQRYYLAPAALEAHKASVERFKAAVRALQATTEKEQ